MTDAGISPSDRTLRPSLFAKEKLPGAVRMTPAHHARNESSHQEVLLEDLVHGRRRFPATKELFLDYLKSRHNEENFEFLEAVRKLRDLKEDPEKLGAEMKSVYDTYIVDGSPKEVNVSHEMRLAAKAAYEKAPTDIEAVFGPSEKEVKRLMINGRDVLEFFKRQSHNLVTKKALNTALGGSILMASIAIALLVALVVTKQPKVSRMYVMIPAFMSFVLFAANWVQTCPLCAATSWHMMDYIKMSFLLVEDEYVLRLSRIRATFCVSFSLVCAAVLAVALTYIPF